MGSHTSYGCILRLREKLGPSWYTIWLSLVYQMVVFGWKVNFGQVTIGGNTCLLPFLSIRSARDNETLKTRENGVLRIITILESLQKRNLMGTYICEGLWKTMLIQKTRTNFSRGMEQNPKQNFGEYFYHLESLGTFLLSNRSLVDLKFHNRNKVRSSRPLDHMLRSSENVRWIIDFLETTIF